MDERIDLTENRDFRDDRDEERRYNWIISELKDEIQRINFTPIDDHVCYRCGRKVIFLNELCPECDFYLEAKYNGIFKKEEIQSIF